MSEPILNHDTKVVRGGRTTPAGRNGGGLVSYIGMMLSLAVVAAATALALVFAATLAVVLIVVGFVLSLLALAWRAHRRPVAATAPITLSARKVGHAWVAYWDDARP